MSTDPQETMLERATQARTSRRTWLRHAGMTVVGAVAAGGMDSSVHQSGGVLNEFLDVTHQDDETLRNVYTVVNVRDFGARGDGSTDDTEPIQNAASAISEDGGILFFPAGIYKLNGTNPIALKHRTWVLGTGHGSVLRVDANANMLQAKGTSHIRVSHLSFVFGTPPNYATALGFEGGAHDITVDSCSFAALTVPSVHMTLHAVLAKGVQRIWIVNNHVYQMQIKTGADAEGTGFHVMGPGIIANNYIRKPRNFGISATHFTDPTEIVDMSIINNSIEDPAGEGGIYVGTDSDHFRAKHLKRIIIQGNIIQGQWTNEGVQENPRHAVGILVRAAETSEQIHIEDNVISKDGIDAVHVTGIEIGVTTRPTTMRALIVADNTIRNTDLWGIRVQGDRDLSGCLISGNLLDRTGGIALRRGIMRDGIVASNITHQRGGLHLQTVHEGDRIGPLIIRDNIFKNSPTDGITLEAVVPNTLIHADLIGNTCYDDQAIKTQHYGMREIGPGPNFDTRYLDNDVRGNAIAGLSLVNPAAIVRNNRGWVTESKGAAMIAANRTSVSINHGLSVIPAARDITITPTNNPPNAPLHIWISTITATQFTVNCAAPPGGSGLSLEWNAIVI